METIVMNYLEKVQKYKKIYQEPEKWSIIYINGEPTQYSISNYGEVINSINSDEEIYYLQNKKTLDRVYVKLKEAKFLIPVYRLVANAFIPIPQKYLDMGYTASDLDVDHIRDGDLDNHDDNTVWNLQWLTHKENVEKTYEMMAKKKALVHKPKTQLSEYDIKNISDLLMMGRLNDREIARLYNVSFYVIRDIRNKKRWTDLTKDYNFDKAPNRVNGRINKFPQELTELVKEMINTGSSNQEIYDECFERFGYGKKAIKSYVEHWRKITRNILKEHVEHDPEFVKQVDDMINSGKSNAEIIAELGIPEEKKYYRLFQYRRTQLKKPANKAKYFTNEESDKVNEMLVRGASTEDIIKYFGKENDENLSKIKNTISSRKAILKHKNLI